MLGSITYTPNKLNPIEAAYESTVDKYMQWNSIQASWTLWKLHIINLKM